MKKDDKASISLKKVISVSIILLFIMGIGVMAASSKLNSVKIILSDGYEMDVLTSKTNISEILEENHIIVLPNENVIPALDDQISDNKTIRISANTVNKEEENTQTELSVDKIMENYDSVSEKIVKEEETIEYETETKDLSTGSGEKEEKVTRKGKNGTREIVYKVKYHNGEEIEKTKIAENVVAEPVNCIKEIRDKRVIAVTSRSSEPTATTAVSGSVAEYQAYAREKCYAYGWSDYDFDCLVRLWNRESGWNPNACNRSSGAYGIPQNNNSSKYESWYRNNAYAQIDWGINYISGRYGSPSGAWAHSQRTGWY